MSGPALLRPFKAEIHIIVGNPFVSVPETTLRRLFEQAGKDKSPIPVRLVVDGHPFTQTLVRYAGAWRLYLNGPMLKATAKSVGDMVSVRIAFDPRDRSIPIPSALRAALKKSPKARNVFDSLAPSRQKEIVRYIAHLKSKEAVERNLVRAIGFLVGKARFVGRDKPSP